MSLHALSDPEVVEAFGDPTPFLGGDGRACLDWERKILAIGTLPAPIALCWDPRKVATRFRAHYRVVHHLEAALLELHSFPEVWETVNDWGGVYEWRTLRQDRRRLSRHSWGIAVDMDVRDNPQGGKPKVHPLTIEIMERHGFAWGGFFRHAPLDPQHFEFADLGLLGEPIR